MNTNTKERESLNIANCLCCTLASNMRDCKTCQFNVGLIVKGLQAIKQAEEPVNISAIRKVFTQQILISNSASA